ncbi:hypothetical protein GBA52_014006 [Prunus armeniaca]|nr:hypothetical protein GBA52_014006 [Prunus armeniaca]
MALVKSTGDYFHGKAGKDEGLRLFRGKIGTEKVNKCSKKEAPYSDPRQPPTTPSASNLRQPPSPDLHKRLFPAIQDRRMDNSSSDDES